MSGEVIGENHSEREKREQKRGVRVRAKVSPKRIIEWR